ncbi:hypothetical protein OEZ85_006945 [Tetradesmus obliquus]|uniref:Rab-GAP TBC domain-containing protein n=1 Tax=Tetradesmus obliquus TaxID=3088 RepID=A0ABY8TW61_TETOB|nr:hypothetical protein OEZ85_006945 [Tetradesmus obliquus]
MFLPDVPLAAVPRTSQELDNLRRQVADLSESWERIGGSRSPFTAPFNAPSVGKLLYDAEDVLQALTAEVQVPTPSSNGAAAQSEAGARPSSGADSSNGKAQQPVHTSLLQAVKAPSRAWLQSFFADLKPEKRQVGVDDVLHTWFREQQVQQAYRAAGTCSAAACRAAARTGLPASERPWVWAAALGIHAAPPAATTAAAAAAAATAKAACGDGSSSSQTQPPTDAAALAAAAAAAADMHSDWWRFPSERDRQVLQLLCESVEQQVLLTDLLVCADVQRMADSEHYFVFEEAMRAMLLAFSRDASASINASVPAAPRLAAEAAGNKQLRPYPPSGILPFQGMASYLAPLCYLYEQPAAAFRVFAAMYGRYWCRLHTINVQPAPSAGLPVLCRTFLELLQDVDAEVYRHLSRLGPSALDLAFPWIMAAFVGHLSPAETLLLWDRIIGFDSLLPLPVLAAAVMTFRRDLVLAVHSSDELLEVLEDLSQLKVVPLMQAVLFDT